jgi:phosphoserine phosphatase RsbU/P
LKLSLFTENNTLKHALLELTNPNRLSLNPQSLDPAHLIVIDQNLELLESALKSVPPSRLYFISDRSDEDNIDIIKKFSLSHLIGFDEKRTAHEILQHYNIFDSKSIWGPTHYLASGVITDSITFSESKREMSKIAELIKTQVWDDFFDTPADYINLMANELVSNALYNGPEGKRNGANYPVDRKDPVFLKGSELIQLKLGIDHQSAVLSVIDCFGTLTKEKVIQSLYRSFKEKTVENKKGGAGLGLYLSYLHGHQFIVNSREGVKTEVIIVIEKTKRYKNYKSRRKSFHFFDEANLHE